MDNLQTRRSYIKYGLIIAVIFCVLSGPFIFAQIQHRQSRTMYEDSLEALRASGFPHSANEHISTSMQSRGSLDLTRQNQLLKLLNDAENWDVLSSNATYSIQKPIQLDADQLT